MWEKKNSNEYLSSTENSVQKKFQASRTFPGVCKKRSQILKLLIGGEYNVKMVARAFGIPSAYELNLVGEDDAVELMREESAVELIYASQTKIARVHQWLRDEAYFDLNEN
jgi:hypothetical protein